MVSIDALFVELHAMPTDERTDWQVMYALSRLDARPGPASGRAPVWFAEAVIRVLARLATHRSNLPVFRGIRSLEVLGVLMLEHDDAYVLSMVSALGDRRDPQSLLDALRGDTELRESLLWRVFEVEGNREVSLTNVDKYCSSEATWAECFRTLVAEGTLSGERVLMGCLQALGRDFSAYRAGFFSRLFVGLAPSADQVVAGQVLLLRLLRARVAATVAFAVRQLAVVDQAGALDEEAFVAGSAAALMVPGKGAPIAVIDLAARIARRRPELARPVAETVALGLEHRDREVQSRALQLLGRLDAGDLIAARMDLLEPTVARAAGDLLGTATGGLGLGAVPQEQGGMLDGCELEQATEDRSRSRAGDDDRSAAERAVAVLAGDCDPWQIELLLATIASGAAAGELAALAKLARRVLRSHADLRRSIAALLLAEDLDVNRNLLTGRLAEVLAVTKGGRRPGLLLATPTDPVGWLDPLEFIARLSTAEGEPAHYDLVAALLRLHMEGRDEALRAARDLPGDAGAAARYALGGPPSTVGNPAVWVAAARSRAPLEDDPHLIAAGLGGAGQGRAAQFELRFTLRSEKFDDGGSGRIITWKEPSLAVGPVRVGVAADQPTVLASRKGQLYSPFLPGSEWGRDWLPWAAQIWPHDAEPFFAADIGEVMSASYDEGRHRTGEILDVLLTHPGRLGPMAATVLAAGLTTREIGHRARAAEAFATLLSSRRLDTGTLAAAMANLAEHATATRWAATLGASGAAAAVVDVLTRLLPELPRDYPGLHALLSTFHEDSVRARIVPAGDELRAWLTGFAGSTKATKTARAILAEMGGRP